MAPSTKANAFKYQAKINSRRQPENNDHQSVAKIVKTEGCISQFEMEDYH